MIHASHIVTRFAPSPTGAFHIGSARTALFNFAFAQKNGGAMILRIEDTDKERSKKEYEEDILESMRWLGITYSALHRQSERKEIYRKHIARLIETNHAYVAEDGVIRFKNPSKTVSFDDLVRGPISTDTTDLGDFIIARSAEDPLYHLAVVLDDYEMGVTHVIRGEDHISNTPRHILIQEAIGAPRPAYIHIPLILAPDRSKLSKRHGATAVADYRKEGYLSEAVINFMALLGWSPQHGEKEAREIFTLKEFVEMFSIEGIQKGGAVFDIEKLKWVNREHIKRMSPHDLEEGMAPFLPADFSSLTEASRITLTRIIAEKISVFSDIAVLADEFAYFFNAPRYEKEKLLWKDETSFEKTKKHLIAARDMAMALNEKEFLANNIKERIWDYATREGRGNVLWPFRFALSGREKSSDPFLIAEILGKQETVKRLTAAIALLP